MRKNSRKFWFAVAMCTLLVLYALLAEEYDALMRTVLLTLAALVACVWIVCEGRIDRAAAPLRIEQESCKCSMHPPDQKE